MIIAIIQTSLHFIYNFARIISLFFFFFFFFFFFLYKYAGYKDRMQRYKETYMCSLIRCFYMKWKYHP